MATRPRPTEVTSTPEETIAKGMETAVLMIEDDSVKTAEALQPNQVKVKKGIEMAMKSAEEFVTFSQGNVEAVVKSSQIWTAGVQDLSKQVAASAQATFDETVATFKALAGVKSLKDAFELQANFARAALEKAMAESGKLTDASFKLTEQTLAPITARVSVAVEKLAKAA